MPTYRGDDGALLHYDVLGGSAAPTLIVLAGGAAQHPAYLGDLAGLSEHHRLVIPHLRGVGRSSTADLDTMSSRWNQADDVDRLRASLGLERCAVVAHSAGTRLAIAYAARFGDRLSALLLITPPASYLVDVPSDAPTLAAARMADPVFAAATAAFDAGPDTSSEETFNAWQQASAPRGYASWTSTAQAHARAGWYSLAAARVFFDGDGPTDLRARLGYVLAPTLVIAGAQDATIGVRPVIAVADLFPHGRAAVIENSGHFPWVENPDAFRSAVDPFLTHGQ